MHSTAFKQEDAALILIDLQTGTLGWTRSQENQLLKQNIVKLAKIAKLLDLPILMTSNLEDNIQGPIIPELRDLLPEAFASRIQREGIINAMHHEHFYRALQALGRKKLLVAGITTEIAVTFPVLQMLEEHYQVQLIADASASFTRFGDDKATARMRQAGATITTLAQVVSELAIDWTSPRGLKLGEILNYH